MYELIFSLHQDEAGQLLEAGGKAVSLHRLGKQGLTVPPGMVIATSQFENLILKTPSILAGIEKLYRDPTEQHCKMVQESIENHQIPTEIIDEFWEKVSPLLKNSHSHALIVRSSATVEDAPTTSFAGVFESVLNVTSKEKLVDALLGVYASVFDFRVLHYCKHQQIPHEKIRIAVIVQQMIASEKSGVVFTINPLTANDCEISIEAVHGMGEAMANGSVTPDGLTFNWRFNSLSVERSGQQELWLKPGEKDLQEITHRESVLSEEQVRELSEISLEVQAFYGHPQDIEWAFADGQFFIVQSRPITSYRYSGEEAWTNADFKDGGVSSAVSTPLMLSLYKRVLETSMPAYLKSVNLYPTYEPSSWGKVQFSILYWNMKAVKDGVMKIPGFTERQFDEDLGINPEYKGSGKKTSFSLKSIINGIQILFLTNRSIKKRSDKNKVILNRLRPIIEEWQSKKLSDLDFEQLRSYFQKFINDYYMEIEVGYFNTIYDNSNCKTILSESLQKYNARRTEKVSYLKLVPGIDDISHLRPLKALWRISQMIRESENDLSFYKETSSEELERLHMNGVSYPFRAEVEVFLRSFGYHSEHELDISKPNWIESPRSVFQSLKEIALEAKSNQHPDRIWRQQYLVFEGEFNKIKSKSLRKKLLRHRDLLWWREEMRDYSTRMYHILRRFCLEMGKRLVEKGMLIKPDDIFFLSDSDILSLMNSVDVRVFRDTVIKNRQYYQGFRNFRFPDEMIPTKSISENRTARADILSGIPCSSGTVSGVVRVVADISQIREVAEGEILVTRFTDPGWTSVFSRISGLVTETGGMLSHGAIVSREYGIPAVLGVKESTRHLKNGMKVMLDGNSGTVQILKE